MLTYTLALTNHGRRLDSWLRSVLATAAPSYIQQLIKGGAVTVNGAVAAADSLLRLTDSIALKESVRIRQLLAAPPSPVDILYEDSHVVFFNKPARLSVHRTAEHGDMNLVTRGEQAFAARGVAVKLYPVNRLDRDTSGIAVMAKSSARAGDFGRLFQEGLVTKCYLAVVSGRPAASGVIDLPLDGKESHSNYRTLFSAKGVSVLAVTPVTGRSHQIRRHLASLGHPVLGDRRYGGRPLRAMDGHALHSCRLDLLHPVTGAALRIVAPLPASFAGYLTGLAGEQAGRVLDSLIAGDDPPTAGKASP
jgi:23S rRNA pseudouridine955/2504/2580 synthase